MKVINTGGKFFQFSFCWNTAGRIKIRPHPFCEASCQFSTCILFAFQMAHHTPNAVPGFPDFPPHIHMTLLTTDRLLSRRPLHVGQPPCVLMNSEQQDLLVLKHSTYSDLYWFTKKPKIKKSHQTKQATNHRAIHNVLVSGLKVCQDLKTPFGTESWASCESEDQHWDQTNHAKLKLLLHYCWPRQWSFLMQSIHVLCKFNLPPAWTAD